MRVREVMVPDVATVAPDTMIDAAARLMADFDVGALPVGKMAERPAGILTGRDILVRVVAKGSDPRVTPVAEVMSERLFCCHVEDDAAAVLREMERHQVRRMPVVDGEGRMIGMVTAADLTEAVSSSR